jgi:hypothetical protein
LGKKRPQSSIFTDGYNKIGSKLTEAIFLGKTDNFNLSKSFLREFTHSRLAKVHSKKTKTPPSILTATKRNTN